MRQLIIILLLVPFSLPVLADNVTLSLDGFIARATAKNPGVQRILAQDDIAAGQFESNQGVDDTTLSVDASREKSEPNAITGFEPNSLDTNSYGLGLERVFSATGTRVNAQYRNTNTHQTPAAVLAGADYYQPSVTLQITQPLLKNFGGVQDELNVELSRLNLDATRLQTKEELESYLTRLAALYADWYLAHRETQIAKAAYENGLQQEDVTRLRVRRQVAERHELYRVQEFAQGYYAQWQQALGRFRGLSKEITLQIAATKQQTFTPVDPALAGLVVSTNTTKHNYIRTDSRLKAILDNSLAREMVLKKAQRNALLPDLDLSLGYTRHGVEPDNGLLPEDDNERNDYAVQLQYRYPLGNKAARGQYRARLAEEKLTRADVQQRLIDAEAQLTNTIEQANQTQLALEAIEKQIKLGARKIKAEQRLYRIGRMDLFQLLQDQSTQLNNELNREQLASQWLKLRLTVGELLDRNLSWTKKTTGNNR